MQALINVTKNDIVIDDRMDPLRFALDASNLTSGNVDFYTLPIEGFATRDGQSVNLVDPSRVQAEVRALLSHSAAPKTKPAPSPKLLNARNETVDIYNGSSQNGLAAQTSAQLLTRGFRKGTVASIGTQPQTTITYGPGARTDADILARQYATTATLDASLPAAHIRIDLGTTAGPNNTASTMPTTGAQGSPLRAQGGIPCVN